MAKNTAIPRNVNTTGTSIAKNIHFTFPLSVGFQPMLLTPALLMIAAMRGINMQSAIPAWKTSVDAYPSTFNEIRHTIICHTHDIPKTNAVNLITFFLSITPLPFMASAYKRYSAACMLCISCCNTDYTTFSRGVKRGAFGFRFVIKGRRYGATIKNP